MDFIIDQLIAVTCREEIETQEAIVGIMNRVDNNNDVDDIEEFDFDNESDIYRANHVEKRDLKIELEGQY